MKYKLNKQEKFSVLELEEKNLNSVLAPHLKSEFIFLRNEGVRNLILDLSNVQYVDSSGLSAILTANRLWKGYGVFILTGIDYPPVKKLIEISRLNSILNIIPTLEESEDFIMLDELDRSLSEEE